MTPRAVLFDATGTLIETREPVGLTYARVAAAHGADISAWRLGEAFGRAMASAPALVFPDAAPDEVEARERAWWRERVRVTFLSADSAVRPRDFEACFEALFTHFARADAWALRSGVVDALTALTRAGLRLAVVSNFDRRLPGVLEGLGIARCFDTVVLPSDCGAAKPDPAIFRCALERLDREPAESVFVGDDALRDLQAARRLGMQAVDVGSLATLAELPAAIAGIERTPAAPPPQETTA